MYTYTRKRSQADFLVFILDLGPFITLDLCFRQQNSLRAVESFLTILSLDLTKKFKINKI